MTKNTGWKIANVHNIPPLKDTWSKDWHSVRHYFDIKAFGVNASTKNAGESLTPAHDELKSGQQELFIVLEGEAEFVLNKQKVKAPAGMMIAIEPEVIRSATSLKSPTTIIIVGAKAGEAYSPQAWEKI